VSARIRACNSDNLVEAAEETFNTNGFVVAMRSSMEMNAKKRAGFAEDAAESASSIDNDEAAYADFEENFLEQKASEFMRTHVNDRDAHHKLGEWHQSRRWQNQGSTGRSEG
jgi:hypothetical protein